MKKSTKKKIYNALDKMEKFSKKIAKPAMVSVLLVSSMFMSSSMPDESYTKSIDNEVLSMVRTEEDENNKIKTQEGLIKTQVKKEQKVKVVYQGLTMDQLATKLNRNLGSDLKGKGRFIAEYSVSLGLDPYLAIAIMMHETGCNWKCSKLARQCNNFGGQKGSPSCGGGSYKRYATPEAGLKGMMDNLYHNYYSKGLKTPRQINKKYAESMAWSGKITGYMNKIKRS